MKKQILKLLLILISFKSFGQDTIAYQPTHTQIFSLSPISKKVDKVNGLVFGVGHVDNKRVKAQRINGLNLEVNPAPIVGALIACVALIYLPDIIKNNTFKSDSINKFKIEDFKSTPDLRLNGINISTGCFFIPTTINGLNISLGNKFKRFNGLSIAPLGTIAGDFNGLGIGFLNTNTNLNGVSLGIYNQTFLLKGLQFGMINQVKTSHGIQIGIYNRSYSRGLQLGFWNKNSKHSFPLINF